MFSAYQMQTAKIVSEIQERYIVTDGAATLWDSNSPVVVPRGSSIRVVNKIDRNVDGRNTFDRIVETPNGEIFVLETFERVIQAGKSIGVVAEFKIPEVLPNGCGYKGYTSNNISIDWNLISLIKSIHIITPSTHFCIVDKRKPTK